MRTILALAVTLTCAGCGKLLTPGDGGRSQPIREYPDGADGLRALWLDVLDAAKKDERQRVHDLLASTIMNEDDLQALFGAQAQRLFPRYKLLMEALVNRGAIELVGQVYDRKCDDIEVLSVEPSGPIVNATPADRTVAKALTAPLPIYAVRVKKSGETRGLRYDFFFYRRGRWLTGNQLGKYLD
jgi:hypothetical protein